MLPVTRLSVSQLFLDEDNPRLRSLNATGTQFEFIKVIYTEMAVDEIAMSIFANGYFDLEPLLVVEDKPARKGQRKSYTVVEGNRRLTAVKLLTDDELRQKVKANDLPRLRKAQREELETLPCIVYPDVKELWRYLGFRHINGVKPWDAFSKAAYVAEVHEKYSIPLEEIAADIGDRHSTVVRLYRGLTVLRQAEKQGFSKSDVARSRFYFSHLYTAIDETEFQKFLGITPDTTKKNPVPAAKHGELQEFMTWLYGSRARGIDPVVTRQNPDLGRLRETLAEPKALAALRRGAPLKRAHEISLGDIRRFSDALFGALEQLQEANGLFLGGFDKQNEGLAEAIEQIQSESDRLYEQLDSIPAKKSTVAAKRAKSKSAR